MDKKMYIYTNVYIYICMCIYIHIYTHIYTHTYVCVCVCVCVCIFPGGNRDKESACQCRRQRRCKRYGFDPWIGKIWRQPTPVFFPVKSDWQRSLVGYSSWSHKESNMNEHMHICSHTHTHTHTHKFIINGLLLSHEKNEILWFMLTWMNLEGFMLSEISQRETNNVWFHLYVI